MSELRAVVGVAAAFALLAATTAPARADDRPFSIGPRRAWFLLGGVTAGASLYDTRAGFVGGEVSVNRLRQGTMVGVYGDAYYDFGVDGTYLTGGLELGKKVGMVGLGVDGGAALRFAYGDRNLGASGRVFASVGVLSLYARYLYLDGTERNDHVVQVGVTLKLPLVSPW